jgi:hypothetical protein
MLRSALWDFFEVLGEPLRSLPWESIDAELELHA